MKLILGACLAVAVLGGVALGFVTFGGATYMSQHYPAFNSLRAQAASVLIRAGEKLSPHTPGFPLAVVHDDYGAGETAAQAAHAAFEKNSGRDVAETIADGEVDVFWRHLRAWDTSVRLLAQHYDNGESIRLAVRPYGQWWMRNYVWLINHLRALGYEFRSFNEYDGSALTGQKLVYLRYDVHLRDVAPLYAVLDANMVLGVPSVSFLMWDYTAREQERRSDFLNILKFRHPLNGFALHTSPVPGYVEAWLRERDSASHLIPWLSADGLRDLLDGMRNGEDGYPDLDTIRLGARDLFTDTARAFRDSFPDARLISYHGSGFDRELRRLCKENEAYCAFQGLSVYGMAETMQEAAGRDWLILDQAPIFTAPDTVNETAMLCIIDRQARKGDGFAILIHPAQLFRNRRHYSEIGLVPGEAMGDRCAVKASKVDEGEVE